jgi:predicted small lipoprotein YifL
MLNYKTLIALVVAASSLAGCGDKGNDEFMAAKVAATQQASAWDGYAMLMKAKLEGYQDCRGSCSDERYDTLNSADDELKTLYLKALGDDDVRAYRDLYFTQTHGAYERRVALPKEELRQENAPKLLRMAEQADASKTSPDVLEIAGYVLGQGRYVIADYGRAVKYLHEAYLGGSKSAAATASNLFQRGNDPQNAYFWALRCIGDCQLDEQPFVSPEMLAKQLTPATVLDIQKAAADRSKATL